MRQAPKIGFISSPGGHFVEVHELLEAFEGLPRFFLTYQERAAAGRENTYYLTNFARRPITSLAGFVKIFRVFLKERPRVLFSTGAEIAIPCFYIGKLLFRTKLIYVECSAQVFHPSLTGRWVYPICDLFLVQWEPLLERYGPRAKYAGGLI